ncbi:MAG: hypothetical protein PWP41_1558 [Moorella sp. (in: firmicutes)]|nr:hypothetical protein [Moorella sp. (in: firmicutes)]
MPGLRRSPGRLYLLLLALLIAAGAGKYFFSRQAGRLPPRLLEPAGEVPPPVKAYFVRVAVADVRANPDQGSELVTQALLGDEIKILQQQGEWLRGQVPDGYTGWLRAGDVVQDTPPRARDLVAVIVPRTSVYLEPGQGTAAGEALMGTDLPLLAQGKGWVQVWLPGRGQAWLPGNDVEIWPGGKLTGKRRGEDVLATVERLLGVSYLWGGVSLYGIDCSGLTYIAYFLNGVRLPRDADQQFAVGREVARENLKPGDLVFFNTSGTGRTPTHVGIYAGKGEFLNARSRQGVVLSRLDDPPFSQGYLGARRFLP